MRRSCHNIFHHVNGVICGGAARACSSSSSSIQHQRSDDAIYIEVMMVANDGDDGDRLLCNSSWLDMMEVFLQLRARSSRRADPGSSAAACSCGESRAGRIRV